MSLYVVRHAKAGHRGTWDGDDAERPLSKSGWKQAELLADRLAAAGVKILVTSPYVRCVQTLEPLAAQLGGEVVHDRRLGEGAAFEGVLDLLDELPDGAVVCSHGDVIPETIDALVRRGLQVESAPDWRKATVWVIERDVEGRYTHAVVWPPPT